MDFQRRVEDIPSSDGPAAMHRRRWLLVGPLGAVQYLTHWYPPGSAVIRVLGRDSELVNHPEGPYVHHPDGSLSMAVDLGYHSPVPYYEGHGMMDEACDVLGGPCYYDGSSLDAGYIAQRVAASGFDERVIWASLEGFYAEVFEQPREDIEAAADALVRHLADKAGPD